jgi:hypothetical protein
MNLKQMCEHIKNFRTGIVIMLCQSIIGINDEMIISDYHQSEMLLNSNANDGSAAASSLSDSEERNTSATTTTRKGKLSREIFSGSPSEVMVSTLAYIRKKYGSINGYLDTIGFDDTWRSRLILATSTGESIERIDDQVVALKSKL